MLKNFNMKDFWNNRKWNWICDPFPCGYNPIEMLKKKFAN